MCRDRQADKHKEKKRLLKVDNKDVFSRIRTARSLPYGRGARGVSVWGVSI